VGVSTSCMRSLCSFFFFQAEDGIRDLTVTGVQTCALPISPFFADVIRSGIDSWRRVVSQAALAGIPTPAFSSSLAYYDGLRRDRSEERRVGKECRSRWSAEH